MKITQSRNKREGYYAGYYRPDYNEKPKHWRWDAFSMSEFYPPIHGSVWNLIDKEKVGV